MMNMKIVLFKNVEVVKKGNIDISIEMEYGNEEIKGKIASYGHHTTENRENRSPAVACEYLGENIGTIGVSHIDLDTIIGVGKVSGLLSPKYDNELFKDIEFIDLEGQHMLYKVSSYNKELIISMNGIIAENRVPFSKDMVVDVTEIVLSILNKINNLTEIEIIEYNKKYIDLQNRIEKGLYKEIGNIRVFKADEFSNAQYINLNTKIEFDYIISFSNKSSTYTLSKRSDEVKGEMDKIMVNVFGDGAGGRNNIAGSPRGEKQEFNDTIINNILIRIL